MAASEIDQKILGRIAKEAGVSNPPLSAALYQVLGLSVILSRKLYKARRVRRLDITRDTKSVTLYHHIIWLSREGLAITEILIIPYCQGLSQSPKCRVMAAKLRASFYHVFCLFHNQPPVSLLTPPKLSPDQHAASPAVSTREVRARTAALRETIPSMTSEASYITNPYALSGPAQTSPPPYLLPPVPALYSPTPRTPSYPPGLHISPVWRSPPSTADFLLPSLDFVPATAAYFSQANALARQLLGGSDPLRLSIAYESCTFTLECAKDMTLAKDRAKATIKAVYADTEPMEDSDFQDSAALVQAIATITKQLEKPGTSGRTPGSTPTPSYVAPKRSPAQSAAHKHPAIRVSPVRPRKQRSRKMQKELQSGSVKSKSSTEAGHVDIAAANSLTLGNMASPEEHTTATPLQKSLQRSHHGSGASRSQSSSTGDKSEKERKRRRVEQAEQDLERRRNSTSRASSLGDSNGNNVRK